MDFQTLYITFKTDTKGVKQGTKEAKKSMDEFKTSLKDADGYTEKLTESFTNLVKSVAGFVAAGLSASALFKGLEGARQYTTALAYQADQMGLNISTLQAYDQALEHFGGKKGEAAQNIKGVAKYFGTTPELITDVELSQLANTFSHYNQKQKDTIAEQYTFTDSFAQMLTIGGPALKKLLDHQKELGVATHEEALKLKELNDNLLDTSNTLKNNFLLAMIELAPTINTFLKGITEGLIELRKHPEQTKAALLLIAAGFTGLSAALVLANIEFVGIAASVALIVVSMEKLMPLFEKFNAFENKRKGSVDAISLASKNAIGGKYTADDMISGDIDLDKKSPLSRLLGLFDNNDDKVDLYNGSSLDLYKYSNSPVNSQTSGAIANNSNQTQMNNDQSFRMNNVTVVTQAPDAQKMFSDLIDKRFMSQLWKSTHTFRSGEVI